MSDNKEISTMEAIKTMGCNCAVMAGVAFVVSIVACAVVGICPDEAAFIPVAIVAIGGGIAVGGLVTALGGDVRVI